MKTLRKTKIVCTLGPTASDVEVLCDLLKAGMNIARFNFSHGNHEYHLANVNNLRLASLSSGIPVALMLDTKGPEIRTGNLSPELKTITLVKDARIDLTTEDVPGNERLLSISYQKLPGEVSPGKRIFIADGIVELEVISVEGNTIHCEVRNGGEIGSKKNVNVVGVKTSLPAVTEKDIADIEFAAANNFDFIAASFVRKAADVIEIQKILRKAKSKALVIAKIEDEEGLENIHDIIRVSGGIMIARGDLGVQLKTEEIPLAQKRIITECNKAGKPVITATQMLDSMINNPRPTRAELTDVANAIFDGTDAVMLSGETANGKFPVLAVDTMHRIALTVEQSGEYISKNAHAMQSYSHHSHDTSTAIARAGCAVANDIAAAAILSPTRSGTTARLISHHRPRQTIIAATTDSQVQRQLLLNWGVYPICTETVTNSDEMIQNALEASQNNGYLTLMDKVVIIAGIPISSPMLTNTIKVHLVGNILTRGLRGFGPAASGRVVLAEDLSSAMMALKQDGTEILVAHTIDVSYLPLVKKLKGIVLEGISHVPWQAIIDTNPSISYISEVANALSSLEKNMMITLDPDEKIIYEGFISK